MTPLASRTPARARPQRGASLFVVIAMIAALGMLMLTAYYAARNQFAIVGNLQYQEQAFAQAEAVVATAQNWLDTGTNARSPGFTTYDSTSTPGLYPIGGLDAQGRDPRAMTWSNSNSVAVTGGRYLVQRWANDQPMAGSSLQQQQAASVCRSVNIFQVIGRADPVQGSTRMVEVMYATLAC